MASKLSPLTKISRLSKQKRPTKLFQILNSAGYPLGTIHAINVKNAIESFRQMASFPTCFEPLQAVKSTSLEAEKAHQRAIYAMATNR